VRIGLVIPRFKHSAVLRNQLKRRLRELARMQLVPLIMSVDVVMKIRPDAYKATFEELAKNIGQIFEQLDQWRIAAQDSSGSTERIGESHETL
jgi:ribonuclease P protein component